jgi:hypothetical protein
VGNAGRNFSRQSWFIVGCSVAAAAIDGGMRDMNVLSWFSFCSCKPYFLFAILLQGFLFMFLEVYGFG